MTELLPASLFLAAYLGIPGYVLWRRWRKPIQWKCQWKWMNRQIPAGRRVCWNCELAHYGKRCPNCKQRSDAQ